MRFPEYRWSKGLAACALQVASPFVFWHCDAASAWAEHLLEVFHGSGYLCGIDSPAIPDLSPCSGFCQRIAILLTAAEASLCRNGKQRIGQLCQHNPEQIQLIVRQPAGERIGNGCNRSRQFTRIQQNPPHVIICTRAWQVPYGLKCTLVVRPQSRGGFRLYTTNFRFRSQTARNTSCGE